MGKNVKGVQKRSEEKGVGRNREESWELREEEGES